jgi:TldD protein
VIDKDLQPFKNQFSAYTELRLQENSSVGIAVVDGTVMGNSQDSSGGISARVFKNGGWGFASTPDLTDDSIRSVIRTATENAAFMDSKLGNSPHELPSVPGQGSNTFATTKARSSQRELIDFVRELDSFIVSECPGLSSRTLSLRGLDMEKSLLTSDGSEAYLLVPRSICYIMMSIEKDGVTFELFDVLGGRGQFEDVFSAPGDYKESILGIYENLKRKADGVYAEAGLKDCILDADLAGVFAHEAIGHTTEADLVIGGSVAGEYVGKQVGSPLVNMVDFANTAFGETCPVPVYVDDEGTSATDAVLIKDGVLEGFMHNKESAVHFGAKPTGNAKAYRFNDEPLIRMRNTTVLPGESTLDEMIASIDSGYYLLKFNNGQADTTSEFMFGITLGYEINNGKLGKAIRDTTISGVAFETLKTVSMISNDLSWSCSGMCGKKQQIPVGMGGPAIKCKVSIGGR